MRVCLGTCRDNPVMLELLEGIVYIDGNEEPIIGLTEDDLKKFYEEIEALPKKDIEGHAALVDAARAAFLVKLLGKAVGDECIDKLTKLLDQAHYNVLQYLGEIDEE